MLNTSINFTEAIKQGVIDFETALQLSRFAAETETAKPETAKRETAKTDTTPIFKREIDPVINTKSAQSVKRAAEKRLAEQNCSASVEPDGYYLWIEKPDDMTVEQFAALKLSARWKWARKRADDGKPAYYTKFKPLAK